LSAFGYDVPPEKGEKFLGLVEKYSHLEQIANEEVISEREVPAQLSHSSLKLLISLLTNVCLYQKSAFSKLPITYL